MAVTRSKYDAEYDIAPHAIIWRPVKYFTMIVKSDRDDLDDFDGADFSIGNGIRFSLRHYHGHPEMTVTLYLPSEIVDEQHISEIIDTIFKEMVVPLSAIAWRRGERFTFGSLTRRDDDRLREPEARILVLKIAAQQPNASADTAFLKNQIPKYTALSKADRKQSASRKNEQLWQQIVGNVISHNSTQTGIFSQGYAEKIAGGIKVTEKGLNYLKEIGFMPSCGSSDED